MTVTEYLKQMILQGIDLEQRHIIFDFPTMQIGEGFEWNVFGSRTKIRKHKVKESWLLVK